MRIPELHVAVPIRAATDGHAEPLCDAGDPPLGARRMARVPHLEAVETLLLELSDLAFGAVVTEVGRDGNPADGVDQLGDLLKGGERLLDVGRPAPTQIARERLVHVDAHPALHQHSGHVGTTQRAAVRGAHDVSDLDGHAEPMQVRHDLLGATLPRRPGAGEEFLEPGVTRREKVAQQVELTPGSLHAELAAGYHPHAERLASVGRTGYAAGRIWNGQ